MKILIHGCNGSMGKVLAETAMKDPSVEIVGGIDPDPSFSGEDTFPRFRSMEACRTEADAVIDFSYHTAIRNLLGWCLLHKTPVVIATTALGPEEHRIIQEASREIPVFQSANMSLGVNVLSRLLEITTPALEADFNVEIVEMHHNQKKDSPSGTALMLAGVINEHSKAKKDYIYGRHGKADICSQNEIGIHAIRGGTIPGEHSILYAGPDEVLTLTHTALSKAVFARGALKAAHFLISQPQGLYSMKDLF